MSLELAVCDMYCYEHALFMYGMFVVGMFIGFMMAKDKYYKKGGK